MKRAGAVVALVFAALAAHGGDDYLAPFEKLLAEKQPSVETLTALSMMHPRWLPPSQPKPDVDPQRLAALERRALELTRSHLDRDPAVLDAYMRLVEDLGVWKDTLPYFEKTTDQHVNDFAYQRHFTRAALEAKDAGAMSVAINFLLGAARREEHLAEVGSLALAAMKAHEWPDWLRGNILQNGITGFRKSLAWRENPGEQYRLHELLLLQAKYESEAGRRAELETEAAALKEKSAEGMTRTRGIERTRNRWSVDLVQDGRAVDGTLQRKPFTIVVRYPTPLAVSVNVAATDAVQKTPESIHDFGSAERPSIGEKNIFTLDEIRKSKRDGDLYVYEREVTLDMTKHQRLYFTFVLLTEPGARLDSRDVRRLTVDLE
jgi:hypothetical protein